MAVQQSRMVFLCQFAQDCVNFRLQELEAVARCMKCKIQYRESDYSHKSPFLVFTADSLEDASKLLQRSVLIKFIYELWGRGKSYTDLRHSLSQIPDHAMEEYKKTDYKFSVRVKGYNKKVTTTYQRDRIEWLSFLPINGQVSLSDPTHEFHLLEDYGENQNNTPEQPFNVYFGRLLGSGQRNLLEQYSLKTRYFIGTTSMDPKLSFIMANMANVAPSSLVLDPFAGTGSILVSCAHFGSYVIGGELDWSIVHGKGKVSRHSSDHRYRGKDDNIRSCLAQYNLEGRYIDVLVADASCSVWREVGELFDAIVTDPPYGVREGSRKVGYRRENRYTSANDVEIPSDQPHYSSKCSYQMSDVFTDLVDFAAKYLITGGHLVYWVPSIKEEYDESLLPSHPCLQLIGSCEQPLSNGISRYLVTMVKIIPWTRELQGGLTNRTTSGMLTNFRDKYFRNFKQ